MTPRLRSRGGYLFPQIWQQATVGNVFGWKRSDGTRRFREAFIFVPRKSGKSEMAGGHVAPVTDQSACGTCH